MHKIVIFVNTPADPSTLLDEALEFAEKLTEDHGGSFDEDEVWIEDVETAEVLN